MKIALVVHDFLRGVGHGRYCIELARRFSRNHEVHVLANRFEEEVDFDFRPRAVPAWRTTALTSVLSFPGAAEKILQSETFDLIHAQGYSCGRSDVITAHVCNAARYKRVPARGLIKHLFPSFVIPRERAFFANSGAAEIIAVSNVVKRELENEYQLSNVRVIYHGVNTQEFTVAAPNVKQAREVLRLPLQEWVWMFAGEATKGLEETLRALVDFSEAHLLVVTRSTLDSYKTLASNLHVENRITWHGPGRNMPGLYQASDVFVYPSRYDTFGMVVAEAMACGLPVIVGKEIGAAEWIQHGENGFLCDPKNLSEALVAFKSQPIEKLEAIRQSARATAIAHTWDRCAKETLQTYDRAISSKRKNR